MSRKVYSIFYSIFFIMAICMGAVSFIGPISCRNIAVVMMLVVNFYLTRSFYIDKYLGIYSIFVVSYFLCSLSTGYAQEALTRIISYYFVCYVGYTSTIRLVSYYENEKLLLHLFIILGIINALAIVGQFYQNPIALLITDFFNLKESTYLADLVGRSEATTNFYMPGIFGVVYSGYMTMLVCILSSIYQTGKFRLGALAISVFFMIACFMVQERSSFALAIVLTIYLIVLSIISHSKKHGSMWAMFVLFLLFIVVVIGFVYGFSVLMNSESRIASAGFDSGRDYVYDSAKSFIAANPFIPGIELFNDIYKTYPHNLFFNAYIYGGPIGFFALMIMLVMMFAKVYPYFFKSITKENCMLVVFSFAFLAYNVNSLVHNNSFVTGDLALWIIWGCIFSLIKRRRPLLKDSLLSNYH